MMNKITYAVALETAIEVLAKDAQYNEVVEKLETLLAQTQKRATTEKKPTATQKANADLKEVILDFMGEGIEYTITDLIKNCDALTDLSNQKVSAMVRQLISEGKVKKTVVKRVSYFSLA